MKCNILLASKPNADYFHFPAHLPTLLFRILNLRLLVTVMLNRLPKLQGFYFLVKKTIHIFESELISNIMMYKRKIKLKLVTFHPPQNQA